MVAETWSSTEEYVVPGAPGPHMPGALPGPDTPSVRKDRWANRYGVPTSRSPLLGPWRAEPRTFRQGLVALALSTVAGFVAGLTLAHLTTRSTTSRDSSS